MPRTAVRLIITLALVLVAAPLVAHAQTGGKVWRLGWLRQGGGADNPPILDAFRQGLREQGYMEGQHYTIEHRSGRGSVESLDAFAAELVQMPVDLLITNGIAGTLAARAATRAIPIVFFGVHDPVERGLVASLAHPGGNLTGVALDVDTFTGKMLELLKEMAPNVTRIASLFAVINDAYEAAHGGSYYGVWLQKLKTATAALKIQGQIVMVRDPAAELAQVFAALAHEHVEALYVSGDFLLTTQSAQIVEHVARNRLPAVYGSRAFVLAGGLLSYEAHVPSLALRAGQLVGRILQGVRLADLPVEQALKYHLAINLKTAKALGITIPPHLLVLADEVIQ